MKYFVLESILG